MLKQKVSQTSHEFDRVVNVRGFSGIISVPVDPHKKRDVDKAIEELRELLTVQL